MYPIDDFINRNKETYQKVSDVPTELINKYKNLLPEELIYVWETMGFGIYEDGFLQLVNPDEYEFVFEYIDKMFEPSIIWGITALGDLLMWEGNEGWTISPEEGNSNLLVNVRKCNADNVIGDMESTLNITIDNFIEDDFFIRDKDTFPIYP